MSVKQTATERTYLPCYLYESNRETWILLLDQKSRKKQLQWIKAGINKSPQTEVNKREIVGLGVGLEYQRIRPTHFIGFHFFTILKQKLF